MDTKPVALITGASRGIGRELALEFSRAGFIVVINFLEQKEKAEDLLFEIRNQSVQAEIPPGAGGPAQSGQAEIYQADISDSREAADMVKQIIDKNKRLDVLVNNAGMVINRSIMNMSPEEWDKVMRVNLNGVFYLIRACSKPMIKQKGGSIINISSIIAARGLAGTSNYAAAKAGIVSLTKTAAKELGRFNIKVNAVMPGFHLTDMGKTSRNDYYDNVKKESVLSRTTDIHELARFVVFLAGMQTVSGQVFNWDSRII